MKVPGSKTTYFETLQGTSDHDKKSLGSDHEKSFLRSKVFLKNVTSIIYYSPMFPTEINNPSLTVIRPTGQREGGQTKTL